MIGKVEGETLLSNEEDEQKRRLEVKTVIVVITMVMMLVQEQLPSHGTTTRFASSCNGLFAVNPPLW